MMLKSQPTRTYGPLDHGRPYSDHMANGVRWTEGYSYEVIDGRLYVSPHANMPHEHLRLWLVRKLMARGSVPDILSALGRHPADAMVALVGHEPTLSVLLAHLLGARDGDPFAFKKGGAALVDLPDGPSDPGRLVWFLKPRVLRALADD